MSINYKESFEKIKIAGSLAANTLDEITSYIKPGISTNEIRDEYKVIGQPLTIILNTEGEIIFREYGYIPTNDF